MRIRNLWVFVLLDGKMFNDTLSDFQTFLISRGFADEKHAPFYAGWVSRFLAFSKNNEYLDFPEKRQKFLELLSNSAAIENWQKNQAETALKLYFEQFDKKAANIYSSPDTSAIDNKTDPAVIIQMMSKAIRVKHYSYKTERVYIGWAKSFYEYITGIKKKDIKISGVSSEDVRDYLSFLAIKKKVSSSSQNQAFNALLFMFRDVLMIGLEDISGAVRAKRGPKLPVVLAKNEVLEIFKHVSGKDKLILHKARAGTARTQPCGNNDDIHTCDTRYLKRAAEPA